jgi:ATP synthase subunit 6
LEQFEPIPFMSLFSGGINLSVTNVTIIFIYIVLVLTFFVHGRLFSTGKYSFVKFAHPKLGTLVLKTEFDSSFLTNFYARHSFGEKNSLKSKVQNNIKSVLDFHSNRLVSYLNFLSSAYKITAVNKSIKENWLGINVVGLPSIKSEYSREFHKVYYNTLKNKNLVLVKDYTFFNNIQLYFNNFLNNLYFGLNNLEFNKLKTLLNIQNILYYFITVRNFSKKVVPNFNVYSFESLYNVILNMIKENIGGNSSKVIRFFPFILSLFLFILTANLIGLIPYSSTVTSYLIVTFAMAVMVLVGVNIIAGRHHGLVYFGHFLPAGCPFALYPLIIPIEFISYVFRVVSLSVRLFANMMAGHTLLAVLAGFGWTMVNANVNLFILHLLPVLVVFVLVFLETAVAIIQAYVFTILTCMYLDEAINLH